jgi:cytochrome c553
MPCQAGKRPHSRDMTEAAQPLSDQEIEALAHDMAHLPSTP